MANWALRAIHANTVFLYSIAAFHGIPIVWNSNAWTALILTLAVASAVLSHLQFVFSSTEESSQ